MAQLIQLSEAASLAIHGAAFMAGRPGEPFSAKQLAVISGASEHHLAKVLQRLVKAGILFSVRGPKGGFSFARPPEEVTLLAVYEAIEGKLETGFCSLRRPSCLFGSCVFGDLLGRFNAEVAEYFKTTRISALVGREAGTR